MPCIPRSRDQAHRPGNLSHYGKYSLRTRTHGICSNERVLYQLSYGESPILMKNCTNSQGVIEVPFRFNLKHIRLLLFNLHIILDFNHIPFNCFKAYMIPKMRPRITLRKLRKSLFGDTVYDIRYPNIGCCTPVLISKQPSLVLAPKAC